MEQVNITLALAILLGAGFLVAKLGNLLRLPSVTGYIIAGLLLGPSGFKLIPAAAVGHQLGHFTQIALMMIAFGIGEHLEIERLKPTIKSVGLIGLGEILGAFILVCIGSFLVARFTNIGPASWTDIDYAVLAILLAAVSVATAPAATLHVMRELKASGPLTTTLMAVVAIDDGLAIMMFGVSVSVAHHLMATGSGSIVSAIGASLFEIGGSLALGCAAGLLIDVVNNRLKSKGEMLTAGLAILLLCGESARLIDFSPLLVGMAAGFTIVNRVHRDMRLFRALNSFEPPIYVLFFTLAGIHLDLNALVAAGWLGLAYFLLRSFGKIVGASIGAQISSAPQAVHRYLGMALTPQAGVAIGLIFLISNDESITVFSSIITPVVLAGVFLSELIGPILVRQSVKLAGEIPVPSLAKPSNYSDELDEPNGVPMVPWTWEKLAKPFKLEGVVLFGANHIATTRALARVAAIFANYYEARPLAVRVITDNGVSRAVQNEKNEVIFMTARTEMITMGAELSTSIQQSDDIAQGILAVARQNIASAIILGHSKKITPNIFQKVIGEVVSQAPCQTIVVQFKGVLHTEQILVSVVSLQELHTISAAIHALSIVGKHQITLLLMLPSYESQKSQEKAKAKLAKWARKERLSQVTKIMAVATDARQETINKEAENHDLVIMAGPKLQGLHRLFFGSLVHSVSNKCSKTIIMVYPPADNSQFH